MRHSPLFDLDEPFHAIEGRMPVGVGRDGDLRSQDVDGALLQGSQRHLLSVRVLDLARINLL